MTSRRSFIQQTTLTAAGLLAPQLAFSTWASPAEHSFRQLRQALASYAQLLKIPGLAAAVVQNGKVTFVQTEGFADLEKKISLRRDHIFPVASLTKTFAAVTLMLYQQEGKISLEDYVLDYPFLSVGFTPDRLPSPNLKLKHVLSHTSEGEPGANYIYNGGRYNFVYGTYEKISGNTTHYQAFADELSQKILRPLKMNDTLTTYPADKNASVIARIVKTYVWNSQQQSLQLDQGLSGATTLYPSAGLLTTLDDLAAYSQALDENTLLTKESYRQMTSPFVSISGQLNPYGLGWSTQQVAGRPVHWHYGYGDSFAALIIRVPEEKLSFILLSNSVAASEPFLLGYGNLLNSVFAQAFFKHIVLGRKEQFSYSELTTKKVAETNTFFYEELLGQALMRNHAERNYQKHKGEAQVLMRYLAQHYPARFQQVNTSLIHLLAELTDPELKTPLENAIEAYRASGWFHLPTHGQIAGWYERNGNLEATREWYHQLADSKGYGEQGAVKKACQVLGKYYLKQGEKEKGRSYLWRLATSSEEASQQIKTMQAR